MENRKQVMSWLEGLTQDDWQHFYSDTEVQTTAQAALELLIEQEKQIAALRRARAEAYSNWGD